MPRANRKGSLPVCLLEQNPLALRYLSTILQKDSSINVLSVESLAAQSEIGSSAPVFIVDNCGLPLPLSECLRRLRSLYPEAKSMVLDRELPKEDLLELLSLKIDGFLTYRVVPRFLLAAVHSVARGEIWIPREILREYVHGSGHVPHSLPQRYQAITPRETQIIELVKRRFSNKEIGDILRIRESTVKFHLSNIYSKLQVASRHDLVQKAPEQSRPGLGLTVLASS